MLKADYRNYNLHFIHPGETSRGVMYDRTVWFLMVTDTENPGRSGIGECAPLPGLSRDPLDNYETVLDRVCHQIHEPGLIYSGWLWEYPSILFGLETALLDLKQGGKRLVFDNGFYRHQTEIPINGLVWMGSEEYMRDQIELKARNGFKCIKLKIGSKDIGKELDLIREIRDCYGWEPEIRVDANGAFTYRECLPVLDRLADLKVHSIEQPIAPGQFEAMVELCKNSPVPVALDEDIVRWEKRNHKRDLIESVRPQYIILKPGLIGGFNETSEWIRIAEDFGTGWWITSALESNIGLNAIAQFTGQWNLSMYQGLGTGQVFDNNIDSPLIVGSGKLRYDPQKSWDITRLDRQ